MSQQLANDIALEFTRISNISCDAVFMVNGETTHTQTRLMKGEQGVYIFLQGDVCFKVGKAGAKSKARWNSHHYNLDATTRSTFPKSFMKDKEQFKQYFDSRQSTEIDNLNPMNVKDWIRNNISRIELKISSDASKYTLNLLEAIAQYKCEPIYEGKIAYHQNI